jgi:hypothetical protein
VKPWPGLVDKEPIPGEGDTAEGDTDEPSDGSEARETTEEGAS